MTQEEGAVRVTVIGVGTPYRADDAVGARVVAGLDARLVGHTGVRVRELDGEPVRLVQAWEGSSSVILVDAVRSGARPGTIHRLGADEVRARTVGDRSPASGHALGLGEALDLASALDRLPASLEVYAVEAASFELGAPMSEVVAAACDALVEELAARIGELASVEPGEWSE